MLSLIHHILQEVYYRGFESLTVKAIVTIWFLGSVLVCIEGAEAVV
jgi:hypothetical protein